MRAFYKTLVLTGFGILLLFVISGCGPEPVEAVELEMAPLSDMPLQVRQASVSVQQAYQFNIANPEIMEQLPCYCGCGAVGHHSNFNCYAHFDEAGEMVFDGHALGCSICVDITLDTMRLLREGRDIPEIQDYVDQNYSRYGPPTIP